MHILGIHFDFPFLRMSRIRKTRKGIEVYWNKTISLSETEEPEKGTPAAALPENGAFPRGPRANVKPLYIENFRGKVVSALSPKDFLIRSIDVNIASQKHVEEAIVFQSEAFSHFKPGEVITIPLIGKKEKKNVEALLFTISREGMRSHLEELKKLGIDPDVTSTIPSALCHFIRWKFPKLKDAFIIHLGSNTVSCALLENGHLKKAHAISTGVEELLSALYEDRKRILLKEEIEGAAKQIDLLLLKPQLNPRLSDELSALRQELAKTIYSFTRNLTKPILFTGRTDAFIHLREFLIEFSDGEWPLSIEEQKFAVSLGLCIEQSSLKPLQLRREEFFPRKNWIRMGRTSLALLCSSIIVSVALVWLGIRFAEKSKKQMLIALQTPFRKGLLDEGNVEEQIDQWIEAIEKNNQEYPYILQAPKVTEILAWLSSHSLLEELRLEGDPIDIREIKVQLVNHPSIHSDREPYLVKVEMEFLFNSMMNARKFHEALREGDGWVDPHMEITWDTLNNNYRISFYLKNRSPHVP